MCFPSFLPTFSVVNQFQAQSHSYIFTSHFQVLVSPNLVLKKMHHVLMCLGNTDHIQKLQAVQILIMLPQDIGVQLRWLQMVLTSRKNGVPATWILNRASQEVRLLFLLLADFGPTRLQWHQLEWHNVEPSGYSDTFLMSQFSNL